MGNKSWSLCESTTGCLMNCDVYTGRTEGAEPDQGLTHCVDLDFLVNNLNCGHHLICDSFSPAQPCLMNSKTARDIGACTTVRVNKRGLPAEIRPAHCTLLMGIIQKFYRRVDLLACALLDSC